jgi:hypothetical protein
MSTKVIRFTSMDDAIRYHGAQPRGTKLLIAIRHAQNCYEGLRLGITATKCSCAAVYEVQPLTGDSLAAELANGLEMRESIGKVWS